MKPRLLLRAFLRTLIVLLAVIAVLLVVASFYVPQILGWAARTFTPPPAPTPPPPTLLAPRGEIPAGVVGLEEWVQYRGEGYQLVGSGFFLRLSDGTVIGVTTAHATPLLGAANNTLEHIAFAINGLPEHVAEFDTLYGPPGTPRTGFDLSIDYVLLKLNGPIDSMLALTPDPRGAPQRGERVSLFSGLGDGNGGRRELAGTVQAAEAAGFWVLMDESFDAGRTREPAHRAGGRHGHRRRPARRPHRDRLPSHRTHRGDCGSGEGVSKDRGISAVNLIPFSASFGAIPPPSPNGRGVRSAV